MGKRLVWYLRFPSRPSLYLLCRRPEVLGSFGPSPLRVHAQLEQSLWPREHLSAPWEALSWPQQCRLSGRKRCKPKVTTQCYIIWASMVLYGSTEKDTQSTQGLRKGGKNKLEKVSRSQPDWLALCVKQEGCWLSLCPGEWMDRLPNGSTTSCPDRTLLWFADHHHPLIRWVQ